VAVYRQGDVLVVPVPAERLPAGLVRAPSDRRGRMVVAWGEATGHAHVLSGSEVRLLCPPDDPNRLYITIRGYGRLTHEEHGAIPLPVGTYRVIRQREYVPGSVRPVAD
jgi:hypothetical protein